jgi:ATP-dependent exoDNAse (exonuclease V) beta subunit
MLGVHQQQIHNESLCLLYVAMTRAVHALHLIVAPSRENEKSLPKTYAGLLRAALHEGTLLNPPHQILYEHGEKNWFAKRLIQASVPSNETSELQPLRIHLRPEDKHRNRRLQRQAPSDLEGGRTVNLRQWFREDSVLSRKRGSLWHAWLEHVDWLDDPRTPIPNEETLGKLAGQFLHPRLKLEEEMTRFQQAVNQPAIREALSRVQYADPSANLGMLASLFPTAGAMELELHHEYPIIHRQNQVLRQGNIDRLVLIMQNGQVIAADILDFKTDPLPKHDSQALNQLGQHYQPQLKAYREAIQQAFSLSRTAVHARLLFLDVGADLVPSSLRGEG